MEWIIFGALLGIIIIKWTNRRERKRKLAEEKERKAEPSRQEPYRWTPSDADAAEAEGIQQNRIQLNKPEEADLSRPISEEASDKLHTLDEAGLELERLSGQKLLPYATLDFGRDQYPHSISVIAPDKAVALQWVDDIQRRLAPGLLCYAGTSQWLGDDPKTGTEVVIGLGETQLDIVRLAQTDACNYDLDNAALIAKLQELDSRYGISIKTASTDTVGFVITALPEDMSRLCSDLYAFCPDLIDQGVGSMEALEAFLFDNDYVELWWD
ncbi:DUF4253 domain-containing protein [Paenibacillus sp. FSL H8-0034]|uniref:DUF4253 domain-containing protein n=1 Tax=Paenibacillus sp. FSL H8-0034 TaxID=2954671 RepID=UPI0030FC0133